MRAVLAEVSKLATLPFVWLAFAAGLLVPTVIAVITSLTSESGPDTGFSELAVGVLGAIILGVAAIGSEYTTEGEESAGGRQITTTLTVIPSRTKVLLAKTAAVILATVLLAVLAIGMVFATVQLLLGDQAPVLDAHAFTRLGGAVAYWVLMALLGFGLTVVTRNGIIPMAILVANSSAVTVTYLLAQSIAAANYLPDLAGMRMFTTLRTGVEIAPLTGGLIMTAWVTALLIVAGAVFSRRDA
ncbi:ABC transporter permease [Nesterenkonia ebinurensis]|uniref:ABC transporter permease n=1 Tax=Nesterenkonia ebinurensis TaxID=2608252 RepID=UPI00123DAC29|nr:ABC transporter permease [Nesterenkonia ebinurensis]